MTGGRPDAEGVADAGTVAHVERSAYVRYGARVLACGVDLAALVESVRAVGDWADGFRVEFRSLVEDSGLRQRPSIIAVADAMGEARPDLHDPSSRLLLVEQREEVWLGEILAEPDRSYDLHDEKPHRTSASLPSRLARALVNLAGADVARVVDPCCGTGSILLEACRVGIAAVGADRNKRMAGMSKKNLEHFAYEAAVSHCDSADLACAADAVVTDLPYGRNLEADPANIASILQACAGMAPVGVFAAGEDITGGLVEAGYATVALYRVRKYNAFTRFIHLAKKA
ncbi:hypothetical protein HN371_14105 [Candidatus Poribacteria bacterium]|mgnify:CR=1 FL=1|nr:hypothetical protein [Candidatus Poribacteria bacterium]MBT5533945.1 hypothetical protein [Candidatus Poribacteria bacterium]MBT5715208.1 hypothetical protein [Candidatus Poribacteria bacterium]MBT7806117.1 hypothetical protein [Candidatus Poribacteria bacterium]